MASLTLIAVGRCHCTDAFCWHLSTASCLRATLGPRRRRCGITVPPLERALLRLQDTCKDAVSEAFTVEPLLARFSAIDLDGADDAATEPAARDTVPLLEGIGA